MNGMSVVHWGPRAGGRGPQLALPVAALACDAPEAGPQGYGANTGDQHRGEIGCRPNLTVTFMRVVLR